MTAGKSLLAVKPWLVMIAVILGCELVDDLTSLDTDFLQGYIIASFLFHGRYLVVEPE